MKKFKTIEVTKSVFDDSALNDARLEGESREEYKTRRNSNKQFLKTYMKFGRERFIKFMEFMKQMGQTDPAKQSPE
jgi:hypothetical protein|tara:strand:- start:283 stop:510 length:228 start_codon:yes stop_codon:yes gene_type:complete